MNLVQLVEKNSRLYPRKAAFVEIKPLSKEREELDWETFADRTNRLANALMDRGITRGDKVFILGKNSIRWVEAYFAVLKTGGWVVPLNFRFTNDDIAFCAEVAEPKAFIFAEEYCDRIQEMRSQLDTVKEYIIMGKKPVKGMDLLEDVILGGATGLPDVSLDYGDDCGLYFTSGTTGKPKPVLVTHLNLFSTAIAELTTHDLKEPDRFLMMPPLYHLAIAHLLGTMLAGATNVLLTEQVTPQFLLQAMSDEQISVVFLLVPWALDLLEALDRGDVKKEDYDLSHWSLTHMGAQSVPPSIVQRLKEYFPDMKYDTDYGLSESTGPGPLHLGMENGHKVGAIGKPTMMWDARIVDTDGNDVAQGDVGELVVRGPGVMKAYYKNPELTAETIKNDWLYTGDMSSMDEDGFISIVDRKKDVVICGGENIFPVEVENVILRHSKVFDVAVIGTPDKRLGEKVTAVVDVVPDESMTEEELNAFIEENLPRYKRPRQIIFDKVPRNPTGKIEKPKLRDKYCKEE